MFGKKNNIFISIQMECVKCRTRTICFYWILDLQILIARKSIKFEIVVA